MFNFLKKIMPTSDTTPNPLLSITDLIDYASVRPEHVVPAVKSLAAQVEAALEKADAPSTPASWENTVEPLEKAVLAFGRAWGAVGHLQSVVDTPALRDAFNEALPIATDLFLRLSQDEKLCDKYRELAASPEFEELAPVRRRITVSIQEVTDESWQINNAAELDAYIEKLRHALKQKLDNGDTLNVDIW